MKKITPTFQPGSILLILWERILPVHADQELSIVPGTFHSVEKEFH